MQPNLNQFGDLLPLAALAIVALAAFLIAKVPAGPRDYARRHLGSRYRRYPVRAVYAGDRDISDSAQQLAAVMAAQFEKQRILQLSEYRAFRVVEQHFAAKAGGHRVFAQTNLGEILLCQDDAARRSINSKRVDILVVDKGGWPVLAVEYQGRSHYRGTAAARDAVKKEALRRAGVAYAEAYPGDTDDQIRSRIDEAIARTEVGLHRASVVAADSRQEGERTPSGPGVAAN